jgi:hypothetical protein
LVTANLLDVPGSPSDAALEQVCMGKDLEGRFPFAVSRSRLGRVLRGWAPADAVSA